MNKIFSVLILSSFFIYSTNAQIISPKNEAERQGTNRANTKIEQGIDKGFDSLEEGIGNLFKKKKTKEQSSNESKEKQQQSSNNGIQQPEETEKQAQNPEINVQWSRFDFVPGDVVIFEDGPDIREENGEFPMRWDLHEGGAEIANVNGEQVITFITTSGNMYRKGIVPYLKNSEEDYLPDVFTLEYDAYYVANEYNHLSYVTLYDRKNQKSFHDAQIDVHVNSISIASSSATLEGKERSNRDDVGGWRHVSVAYTKGKLKVYLEDQRLINIPHFEGNPTGITLSCSHNGMYFKNVHIAKGGVKYYDRVMQDGKIICNGIRFDINKASLKPESMGAINKIVELMQNQPNLKFSVEGHTDADGDELRNQTLSEQRAKAVMDKLVEMGIPSDHLRSKGFGESMPLDNNSPEGKANNRRVEFVRFADTETN